MSTRMWRPMVTAFLLVFRWISREALAGELAEGVRRIRSGYFARDSGRNTPARLAICPLRGRYASPSVLLAVGSCQSHRRTGPRKKPRTWIEVKTGRAGKCGASCGGDEGDPMPGVKRPRLRRDGGALNVGNRAGRGRKPPRCKRKRGMEMRLHRGMVFA